MVQIRLNLKCLIYDIITGRPRGAVGFILRLILIFLSLFYLLAIKLRLAFYNLGLFKSARLKAPVISVGNITWGGTGKTPLVEAICLHFKSRQKKAVLLTRGYGKDEDKFLTESMPGVLVLAGKDRRKNAGLAEEKGPFDIFILDDGFQHQRIKRDIDVVAINAADPYGSGLLIPAGILREPLSHLSRADLAVITRSNLVSPEELNRIKEDILRVNPDIEIFESIHQPVLFYTGRKEELSLECIKDRTICAVSGLGDNRSFIRTLKDLGAKIRLEFSYLDHHRYTKGEMDGIVQKCRRDHIDTVVTTQKDWIKLKERLTEPPGVKFLILKIKLKIDNEERFFSRLSSILPG